VLVFPRSWALPLAGATNYCYSVSRSGQNGDGLVQAIDVIVTTLGQENYGTMDPQSPPQSRLPPEPPRPFFLAYIFFETAEI
jgi:hypothetical protein